MFTDPLVLTVGGSALNFVRINQDGYSSEYMAKFNDARLADGVAQVIINLKIRHSKQKSKEYTNPIDRHSVEMKMLYKPEGKTTFDTYQAYSVFTGPNTGSTPALQNLLRGLTDFAGTYTVSEKMIAWES